MAIGELIRREPAAASRIAADPGDARRGDARWSVAAAEWKRVLPDLPDEAIALLATPVVVSNERLAVEPPGRRPGGPGSRAGVRAVGAAQRLGRDRAAGGEGAAGSEGAAGGDGAGGGTRGGGAGGREGTDTTQDGDTTQGGEERYPAPGEPCAVRDCTPHFLAPAPPHRPGRHRSRP